MIVIIHRVNTVSELNNTPKKYGVEVDIRAYNGKLILNHESNKNGEELEEFLKHYGHKFIILNIKESGTEMEVLDLVKKYKIKNFFFLDVEYSFIYKAMANKLTKNIALRVSEIEPVDMALHNSGRFNWVWIDIFSKIPINKQDYVKLKKAGYNICFLCPSSLNRPEDALKYKRLLAKKGIKIDAVMTEKEFAEEWEN